jgi:hypothetical protein
MLAVVPGQVARLPEDFRLHELLALWSAPQELAERLQVIGLDPSLIEAITGHLTEEVRALDDYRALAERIRSTNSSQRRLVERDFRALVRQWFERKLVVIEDFHASGEQIIDRIAAETPPGVYNRIMGMQNIKGTGLDFVYRWQAWEKCHHACRALRSRNPRRANRALRDLAEFQDFGLLGEEQLQATIDEVRGSAVAQREAFRAELDAVEANLRLGMRGIKERLDASARRRGLLGWLLGRIEEFLDVSDAVRRRKRADRIYRDLENERISGPRAALELRALNRRQKGGWLRRMFRRIRPEESHRPPTRPEFMPSAPRAASASVVPPVAPPPETPVETTPRLTLHGAESSDR